MARITSYLSLITLWLITSSFSLSDVIGILTFTPKHEREQNKLIRHYAKKMQEKNHLILIGSGGKEVKCIEIISLHFISPANLTLQEARQMMVDCTEELLAKINANSILRPHLEQYPFASNNLDLMISFRYNFVDHVKTPYIAFASLSEGIMRYFVALDDNHTQVLARESYEDAFKLVKEKNLIEFTQSIDSNK